MLVLAISKAGAEFAYKANTAHAVSKASAEKIKNALNKINYKLNPGEVWHIHEIDKYSGAYDYASYQKFTVYKNTIKEIRC